MSSTDPNRFFNTRTGSASDMEFRIALDAYFGESPWSDVEKLDNFAKYVPRQRIARFLSRYEIFKQVLTVPGSIIECGVLTGGGLMTWAQLSAIFEPVNHPCRIVGFDFFGESAAIEDIWRSVALFDMNRSLSHIPKVELVKGDLSVTAPAWLVENPHTVVRLLNLDANEYDPTAAALDTFLPRMPKGAVIVFDEINAENCSGETLAVIDKLGLGSLRIVRLPFDTFISYAVIE